MIYAFVYLPCTIGFCQEAISQFICRALRSTKIRSWRPAVQNAGYESSECQNRQRKPHCLWQQCTSKLDDRRSVPYNNMICLSFPITEPLDYIQMSSSLRTGTYFVGSVYIESDQTPPSSLARISAELGIVCNIASDNCPSDLLFRDYLEDWLVYIWTLRTDSLLQVTTLYLSGTNYECLTK